MSAIQKFITEMKTRNLDRFFDKSEDLKKALIELDEGIIGMENVKAQVVTNVKTHIMNMSRGLKDEEGKHTLLYGPPGCGKSRVGRILCKIWMALGFIGKDDIVHTVDSFSKVQHEIIRRQNREIHSLEDKLSVAEKYLAESRVMGMKCKSGMGVLLNEKERMIHVNYDNIYNVLSGATTFLSTNSEIVKRYIKKPTEGALKQPITMNPEADTGKDYKKDDLPFHVIERNDVIDRYHGGTSGKVTAVMEKCFGGVAFFDEAYSLCNDSPGMKDAYGNIALSVINDYMEKYNQKLIVVFAGYEKEIKRQLFTAQPGLPSRFSQTFRIEKYTPDQLIQILTLELNKLGFELKMNGEMTSYFKEHADHFINSGRDMRTLASFMKQMYAVDSYDFVTDGHPEKMKDVIDSFRYVKGAIDKFIDMRMTPEVEEKKEEDMETVVRQLLASKN